jgi:hypothetical protein
LAVRQEPNGLGHPNLGFYLETAASDEAQQHEHEDDDQDDPEDAHIDSFAIGVSG